MLTTMSRTVGEATKQKANFWIIITVVNNEELNTPIYLFQLLDCLITKSPQHKAKRCMFLILPTANSVFNIGMRLYN